jgi:hypothetical protein
MAAAASTRACTRFSVPIGGPIGAQRPAPSAAIGRAADTADSTARRAIARGGYVRNRVFFADEQTAIAAGYRPCATCLPEKYARWKARKDPVRDPTLKRFR